MGLGLGVGALAVTIWALGVRIDVPMWMWRVAVLKLSLAAAIGGMAAGAMLLRHLRRTEQRERQAPNEDMRALAAPVWNPVAEQREPAPQRITTPPETRTP